MESHAVSFSFVHQHNDNAFILKSRVASSPLYNRGAAGPRRRMLGSSEYEVTVMHFAPHPLLMNLFKELGFKSKLEMQKAVFGIMREHLGV